MVFQGTILSLTTIIMKSFRRSSHTGYANPGDFVSTLQMANYGSGMSGKIGLKRSRSFAQEKTTDGMSMRDSNCFPHATERKKTNTHHLSYRFDANMESPSLEGTLYGQKLINPHLSTVSTFARITSPDASGEFGMKIEN